LDVERTLGAQLTENFAMSPASTVSGLYLAHPSSSYFSIGDIQEDQLRDYAHRSQLPLALVRSYLRKMSL
ncbi:MAG: vitamin B12 dependent-methionine synthase activation domain-containing protein, partial [Bacteroidaceae bacterium]|nr:vitamin B12 dependent-methionine synthase activation domain-containing protein [Bacteroidaceae bacterium]